MRNPWWGLLLGCLGACGAASVPGHLDAHSGSPPNIVLIVIDDLGWKDLGGKTYRTPHLDALAKEGMRFTAAYASAPNCSPTRASLMTGLSPARHGVTTVLNKPAYDAFDLLEPTRERSLPASAVTLAEVLKEAGYATATMGKWHLGKGEEGPLAQGFDENVGGDARGHLGSYWYPFGKGKNPVPVEGKEGDYLTDILTDHALDFIERQQGSPLFLYLPFYSVHSPFEGKPDLADAYREEADGPRNPDYAAMVETVDANVGRLLDQLNTLGLDQNTLVVVTSDNGGYSVTDNGPLRGIKGQLYEGGLRVPFIARWPGVTPPGSSSSEPVVSHDLFPTLVEAAGGNAPAPLDGTSLLPLLGGKEALERDALFWHFPHYLPGRQTPAGSIRWDDWKLIETFGAGEAELFDLKKDPGETTNVAREKPEMTQRLLERLRGWREEVNAPMPVRRFDETEPLPPGYTLPIVDLAAERHRQVVVDREPGQYLGHVSTLLLEDGKTILAVYPKGHGKGPIVYKRSDDGGLTWSDRLDVPDNWATSQEVPTIHRIIDKEGTPRLILWSGLYPARLAVSEDDGETWSSLQPAGDWGGIVVMGAVTQTPDGDTLAWFHDDGRFLKNSGKTTQFDVFQVRSIDGGLTWSEPVSIAHRPDVHLCEPGVIRSPDGGTLALLLRENSRTRNSFVIFSEDEGRSWSEPRELPAALTGDRHTARYTPDGRLFITFRDTTRESETWGDWAGWVGTWADIVEGKEGSYRVRLMDNTHRGDCCYPGLELLPDGTFVTTTYGHWTQDESPYIVSVRFTMEELDKKAQALP